MAVLVMVVIVGGGEDMEMGMCYLSSPTRRSWHWWRSIVKRREVSCLCLKAYELVG